MDSRFAGKKILLLDGLTSQCLEYTKAFNGLGCDTTVLCDDRFDTCYASKHPKHKILGVSNVRDLKGTEEWILKLVKSGEYDVVIPFTEYSATILSHHKKELSTYAHLIVNDQDVFDYAQDKNNVMKVCMENDLPCPMTIYDAKSVDDILASNIKFPIILKPSHGFGSHGFHKIGTKEELAACVEKFDIDVSEMVVQEYIPQEGLNVADNLFVDKEGNTKSAFTYASYRFYPIDGGSGVLNETIDRKDIHDISTQLVKKMGLHGPVGVDMIIDARDDTPKVLEVNLRPIACAKLGFLSGINTAQQIMEDLYADEVTPMQQYKTGIRVRRSQIDWMWFIKSPNRFKTKPSWFDRRNTVDQLFSWSDPGPWFDAYKHSRPAVAFDVGALGEQIDDGVTGYLAKPGDVGQLETQLRKIIDMPNEQYEQMCMKSYQKGLDAYSAKSREREFLSAIGVEQGV